MNFLRKLVRRLNAPPEAGRIGVTAWVSKEGPNCYLAAVLRRPAAGPILPDLLLPGDLAWCWASGRLYPAGEQDDPDLPALRPVTPLTAETAPQFLAELREVRWFTLFGADPADPAALLSPPGYQAAITAFARQEAGPLQIAIYQEGDQSYELVFVPPTPTAPVRRLLAQWGIMRETIRQTHRVDSTTAGFIETFMPYG